MSAHPELNFTVRTSCPVHRQAQEIPDRKLGLWRVGGGRESISSQVTSCILCAVIYNTDIDLLGYPPPESPALLSPRHPLQVPA